MVERIGLWRPQALMGGGHTDAELQRVIETYDRARTQGKVEWLGMSAHSHDFVRRVLEKYGDHFHGFVFMYSVSHEREPSAGMFEVIRSTDCGAVGLRPFHGGSYPAKIIKEARQDGREPDLGGMAVTGLKKILEVSVQTDRDTVRAAGVRTRRVRGWIRGGCSRLAAQRAQKGYDTVRTLARAALVTAVVLAACSAGDGGSRAEAAAGWTPVFNGKDLKGWGKPTGHAIWKVEDGMLVGTQTDGRGGDLYTEKAYDNFELRFTYKVVWPANSGVWFRGKYQFDILKYKKPVAFSGTLYCPGKMFITTNLKEDLENRGGWNEGQIYANGDHLILWLNGAKVGECHDKTHAKGPIGIQVHGGNNFKGMTIMIKKMELRPLKPGDKPTAPKPAAPGR